jgi:hypothetical protein
VPIQPQGGGSLTTRYSGTLHTTWDPAAGTLAFDAGGTRLAAADSGNWWPGPYGEVGAASGNYGGVFNYSQVDLLAYRGLAAALTSAPLPLSGSGPDFRFPSAQALQLLAGAADYYRGVIFDGGYGRADVAGAHGTNAAAAGTLTDLGNDRFRLTVPVDVAIPEVIAGVAATARLSGTLRANGVREHVYVHFPSRGVLQADGDDSGNVITLSHSDQGVTTLQGQSFDDSLVSRVVINSGGGDNTVNVGSSARAVAVHGGGGHNHVVLGGVSEHGIDRLHVAVSVTDDDPGRSDLTVDDSNSPVSRHWVMDVGVDPDPEISITDGAGMFKMEKASRTSGVHLTTSRYNDTVSVFRTAPGVPTRVTNSGGSDEVDVGNASGVQEINGDLTIDAANGLTQLKVDDSADPAPRGTAGAPVTIDAGGITGLAAGGLAAIRYQQDYLRELDVLGGGGGNVFQVNDTPSNGSGLATLLSAGGGSDTVNVAATTGALLVEGAGGLDTVNVGGGANGVQRVRGALTVQNSPGFYSLNLYDCYPDPAARSVDLNLAGALGEVSGLAPAVISFGRAGDQLLGLNITGSADNSYTIHRPLWFDPLSFSDCGGNAVTPTYVDP